MSNTAWINEDANKKLAADISHWTNNMGNDNRDNRADLALRMANDHPTLQQAQMRLVCSFIEAMAAKEDRWTDARNQASVKLAREIVKLWDTKYGPPLPFI
jgi:hypothetical protein